MAQAPAAMGRSTPGKAAEKSSTKKAKATAGGGQPKKAKKTVGKKRATRSSKTPAKALKELVDFNEATMAALCWKVHKEGTPECAAASRVAKKRSVRALLDSQSFKEHRRCEPNPGMDSGTLHLLEEAAEYNDTERLKMAFAKIVILPADGSLLAVSSAYKDITKRDLWKEKAVNVEAFKKALRPLTLDQAYPVYRSVLFQAEGKRQVTAGKRLIDPGKGGKQKMFFVNWWKDLLDNGSFGKVMGGIKAGNPIRPLLEETLHVNTDFHRFLLARELELLIKDFPADGIEQVMCVGGGAKEVINSCSNRQEIKHDDDKFEEIMRGVHDSLVEKLDPQLVKAVCPKGWRLDYTEHAGCEMRRFQEATERVGAGKNPRRNRDSNSRKKPLPTREERQKTRCRRLSKGSKLLGFKKMPSLASAWKKSNKCKKTIRK